MGTKAETDGDVVDLLYLISGGYDNPLSDLPVPSHYPLSIPLFQTRHALPYTQHHTLLYPNNPRDSRCAESSSPTASTTPLQSGPSSSHAPRKSATAGLTGLGATAASRLSSRMNVSPLLVSVRGGLPICSEGAPRADTICPQIRATLCGTRHRRAASRERRRQAHPRGQRRDLQPYQAALDAQAALQVQDPLRL